MTVTFNDNQFYQITDQSFTANPKLLTKANFSIPLTTRTIAPRHYLVTSKLTYAALVAARWQPVTGPIKLNKNERLILDLGAVYVGHFQIALDVAGSPMDAPLLMRTRFAERLQELGVDASQVESWLPLSWIQDDTRHVEVLPATVEFERRYSCRYIMLEPVGQSLKWQPVLADAEFRAVSAVLKEAVRPISSDPPMLAKIDQICVATLRNTMQSVFEDGTKRDQRLWLLDFRMQAKVNYVTFKHNALARRCLYLFGAFSDSEGRLPADILTRMKAPIADDLFWFDYQLQFVMALAEYVAATNDQMGLTDLYPVAKRAMAFVRSQMPASQIIGPRSDIFVDWSTDCDKQAAVQGILIQAVTSLIQLATWVADIEVTAFESWLAQLKQATVSTLYDQQRALFVSGPKKEVNLLGQIHLLLARVLSDSEQKRAVNTLMTNFTTQATVVTPSTQALLAEVYFQNDCTDAGIAVINNYWGAMVEQGAETFWEVFDVNDADYSPYGSTLLNSYCFGWSSYPSYLLRAYL